MYSVTVELLGAEGVVVMSYVIIIARMLGLLLVERKAVLGDLCLEAVVMIGAVVDLPEGSVGVLQLVVALHQVTEPRLLLALEIVGVGVVDAVLELVMRLVVL